MAAQGRRALTWEEFERIANTRAKARWRLWEYVRRCIDWDTAHREFSLPEEDPIYPGDPRHPLVKKRAEEIYHARKDYTAFLDWLEVKEEILAEYEHELRG